MKNLILTTIFILFAFSECKKGPDDPLISLRTRKARIEGNWTLKSGTEISTSSGFGGSSGESHTTYTETNYSYVSHSHSGNSNYSEQNSGTFGMKMSFKKDGTFTIEQLYDESTATIKGTWNFTGKTKDIKKKEQIALTLTSTSDPDNNANSVVNSNQVFAVFNIKELRNKKMVLELEDNSTNPGEEPDGTSIQLVHKYKAEYVFEQ